MTSFGNMKMAMNLNHRPGTLAEAVQRYKSGQQKFSVALGEFLDEFYMDTDAGSRYARVEEPPDLVEEYIFDAYIGAVGEHLVRRWNLGTLPEWTDDSHASSTVPGFHPVSRQRSRFS